METLYNLHDPDLEPRLRNWARWCRPSLIYWPIACVGLESNYQPPPCWEPESPKMPIDLLDAFAVEDAIRTLPLKYRKSLKYWYITRLDPRWIAKKAGAVDTGQLMRDAWAALKPLLIKKTVDSHSKNLYNRATI